MEFIGISNSLGDGCVLPRARSPFWTGKEWWFDEGEATP